MTQTRLVMIRHAESASIAQRWISGESTCGGITDRGHAQAKALHRRLLEAEALHPDRVISSSMRRATETTAIITTDIVDRFEVAEDLVERRPGECEGMSYEDYEAKYGRVPWSDWREPLSPGGESDEAFVHRVRGAIVQLVEAHRGETIWVVAHSGVLLATAHFLVNAADANPSWAAPAPTSISEWHWLAEDRHWILHRYNDSGHLGSLAPD